MSYYRHESKARNFTSTPDSRIALKILVIGQHDSWTGKETIIWTYVENPYASHPHTRLGIEFASKEINLDGKALRVLIWDTNGFPIGFYRSDARDAVGLMFVFGASNRDSFRNLRDFLDPSQEGLPDVDRIWKWPELVDVPKIIVCHTSIGHRHFGAQLPVPPRVVSREEGEALAAACNCPYFEVDTRANSGVKEAFQTLLLESMDYERFTGEAGREARTRRLRFFCVYFHLALECDYPILEVLHWSTKNKKLISRPDPPYPDAPAREPWSCSMF